jgi:hypothetical protein
MIQNYIISEPPNSSVDLLSPPELVDPLHIITPPPTNIDTNPKRKQLKTSPTSKQINNVLLSYTDFYKENICLNKYKLPELKTLAKFHKLHISGTKPILIGRILKHFHSNFSAIKIQKTLRMFFVKRSFYLRGGAFNDRMICVNKTDFFTLEPLDEIPFQEFFSYTDASNFTYGFNILSLMSLLKRKGRSIFNPYNRTKIPELVIGNAIRLYLYLIILFPENVSEEEKIPASRNIYLQSVNITLLLRGYYYGFPTKTSFRSNNRISHPTVNPLTEITRVEEPFQYRLHRSANEIVPQNTVITDVQVNERENRTHTLRILPPSLLTLHNVEENENHLRQIRQRMIEIRSKPIDTRVSELFMEIDQLGNYTNVEWFTSLQISELRSFFDQLYDIWRYRGRLSFQFKNRLCPMGDPFVISNIPRSTYRYSIEQITVFCLNAMESLVFTASDIEDRKLGAMYILIALTYVSVPAHANLSWLYESMY